MATPVKEAVRENTGTLMIEEDISRKYKTLLVTQREEIIITFHFKQANTHLEDKTHL